MPSTTPEPPAVRTVLVSFVGLGQVHRCRQCGVESGGYQEARYTLDGRPTDPTRFVARALAGALPADEVRLLATARAREEVAPLIRQELADAGLPEPRLEADPFPSGRTAAEIWDQFRALSKALRVEGDDRVVLDITNSFRSAPLLAAAVVGYLRAIEDPTDVRIVYAAFDARDPGTRVVPVWDLTPVVELADWSRSLLLLLRTGRAEDVAAAVERTGRAARAKWATEGKVGTPPGLGSLARALGAFGEDLVSLRTGSLVLGDARGEEGSARRLARQIGACRTEVEDSLPPVGEILGKVHAMALSIAAEDLAGQAGHAATAALARHYVEMGRLCEAYATLREGWVNTFVSQPQEARPGPGGDCTEAARSRAEQRWHAEAGDAARSLSGLRNDLLHAGYRKSPASPAALRARIGDQIRAFEAFASGDAPAQGPEDPGVFVNVSNHPSETWSEAQRRAAMEIAPEIIDLPFPDVPAEADGREIADLALVTLERLPERTRHAMVQGESTLAATLAAALQARGVVVWAATSVRDVVQEGAVRTSTFRFVRFRQYPALAAFGG